MIKRIQFSIILFYLSISILLVGCAGSSKAKENKDDGTVNTGYTEQEKRDAIGGTSQVNSEDIENRGSQRSVEELLQGRMSGVYVTRARNGGIVVRIRGVSSPATSNQPLYVVDGVPIAPDSEGGLTSVAPEDIDSISVLKGADAALYGVRGANGVIVIKTKRGK